MAGNDPIAAILDQLAAHREQLARLSRTLDEHAAALAELTATTSTPPTPTATSPNRHRSGGTSRPTDEPNPSPGSAPGSSRSTGPATGTWPPPSARAGLSR